MTANSGYNRWAAISLTGTPIPATAAVFAGGAGIIDAIAEDGSQALFTVPAGATVPIRLVKLGPLTTATLLVALYSSL